MSDRLVRLRGWRRLRYVACLTLAAGCGHAVASIPAAPPPPPAPGLNADSLAAADRAREEADRRARRRAADSAAAAADGHGPAAAPHAGWKARPPRRRKENGASAVDVAQSRLSPGQVRYTGPDTMVVDSSVQVHVSLAKGTRFAPTAPTPGRQVVTAETKVGDSARVCLSANPAAFTITAPTGACSTQSVTSGTANHWSWTVTPLRAGTGLLQVQVTALFAGMPGKVEFDSTYSVVVRVAPRPLLTRVTDFLKSWEGILTSLAASAGAVAGILKLFRREPSNPTG